jgi:hypothetical protein
MDLWTDSWLAYVLLRAAWYIIINIWKKVLQLALCECGASCEFGGSVRL